MKVIYNKFIPFPGFFAINLFGIMFIRDRYKNMEIRKTTYNHESIHTEQMLDFVFGFKPLQLLGGIIFYVIYLFEWLVRLLLPGNAYRNISFEKEAYTNDKNQEYIKARKRFSWIKYFK